MVLVNDGMVAFFYNGEQYLVKQSNILDKDGKLIRGVILLPSGIAFDLKDMIYAINDEHGNVLERPRLLRSQDISLNLVFIPIIHPIKA